MKRARVLLADDHSLILQGFRNVLEPRYQIVGEVMDGKSLVEEAVRLKPDLIILDITMPQLNGIEAARRLQRLLPKTKSLFVTMHSNPAYFQEAMNAGGAGYVLKSSAREEILEAAEAVLAGQIYVTPSMLAKGFRGAPRPVDPNRERQ